MYQLKDIYLFYRMFISPPVLFYVLSVDNFFLFILELEASEAAEEDMEEEAVGTSPEDVVDTLDEATAKEEL